MAIGIGNRVRATRSTLRQIGVRDWMAPVTPAYDPTGFRLRGDQSEWEFLVTRLRAPVIAPGDRVPVPRLRGLRGGAALAGPRIWALASGSGGVGRSTLAVTLGSRLVRRGRSACLVDADWSGPSLGTLLDVPELGAAWSELDELRPRPTALHDDLHVVPGASPTAGDPTRADAARLALGVTRLAQDEVLIDLPAGTQDAALDLWLSVDRPVLVAVPERLPLEATARFLGRVFARLARQPRREQLGLSEDAAIVECPQGLRGDGGRIAATGADGIRWTVEDIKDRHPKVAPRHHIKSAPRVLGGIGRDDPMIPVANRGQFIRFERRHYRSSADFEIQRSRRGVNGVP